MAIIGEQEFYDQLEALVLTLSANATHRVLMNLITRGVTVKSLLALGFNGKWIKEAQKELRIRKYRQKTTEPRANDNVIPFKSR